MTELVPIFVGIQPDTTSEKPARTYDDLVNGARELIARHYGQVGEYDHIQTIESKDGPLLAGQIDLPESAWDDDIKHNGMRLAGFGVIVEAEVP